MFESLGVDTGIDVEPLVEAGCRVSQMADFVGDSPPPSKIILDELAKRRAEILEIGGAEAALTLRQLVGSLLELIRPDQEEDLSVGKRIEEAREQVSLFLEAPTNRAAVLFSLVSMLTVSGIAALFVRVLPQDWTARNEVVVLTLFSLGMVLAIGLALTLIQVVGFRLPRELTEDETEIIREAIGDLARSLSEPSAYPRQYEV